MHLFMSWVLTLGKGCLIPGHFQKTPYARCRPLVAQLVVLETLEKLGGHRFYLRLGQFSFRGLMMAIVIGFVPFLRSLFW